MENRVLHVNRELIHHGAEISLLRDLYRWQDGARTWDRVHELCEHPVMPRTVKFPRRAVDPRWAGRLARAHRLLDHGQVSLSRQRCLLRRADEDPGLVAGSHLDVHLGAPTPGDRRPT